MPRTARKSSASGVYHIMMRGVNKQRIFECEDDYLYFIGILARLALKHDNTRGLEEQPHIAIYAYCLMDNHVHLLCKETDEPIGNAIKRITSAYVYYFNQRYNRIGHLFQERFKSETVDDMDYFLSLLRYIHQNPLKANLVRNIADYRWCSWHEYTGMSKQPFCRVSAVLKRITFEQLRYLVELPMSDEGENDFLEVEERPERKFLSDEDAWDIIRSVSGVSSSNEFLTLPRPVQRDFIRDAYEKGVGKRALSRLTGVPYAVVYRATTAEVRSGMILKDDSDEDELWWTYCDEGDCLVDAGW